MWQGEIILTQIAPAAAAPMVPTTEVTAIVGKGLEGDRYCKEIGYFSANKGPHRQVTLFEVEVLETIRRDHHVELTPSECRMNLITRGVPLGHLVGRTFRVGKVVLRGVRLNEPCAHLEEIVGKPVRAPLVHRCGLFAEVLEGGTIRTGDPVVGADERAGL